MYRSDFNRRRFLELAAGSFLGVSTNSLFSAAGDKSVVAPREKPAKQLIYLYMAGGMSHIDSYDYKPGLDQAHGKPLGSSEKPDIFFGQVGLLRRSDFAFKQRGQSGLWLSDMFPNIAEMADEMTVIRSMTTDSANHTPALFFANSGFEFNGFPSVGTMYCS